MSLYKTRGIYKIVCTENNKCYIGSTSMNFGDRRDCHFASLENGYHFNKEMQSDYNKYGRGSFVFEVVEEIESSDIEVFKERERFWIKKLSVVEKGYNISTGGILEGVRPSKEKIRQMIKINREKNLGKRASEETKRKMSASHRDAPALSREDVYSIKQRLMNGESVNEIAKEYNVSNGCISQINVDKNWRSVIVPGWEEYQKNRI